jgi:HEAT repeat protein
MGEKELTKPALTKAMESKDQFLRVVSAWALAQLEPDNSELVLRSARQIIEGLKSKDDNVRHAAARALAESNAPSEIVAPALVEALRKADEAMINQAVDALASLGAKAVPRVLRGLKNEALRKLAAQIIGRIGPEAKDAVPALVEALVSSDDDEYRREIQFALGAIGPEAAGATPALIKALADDNEELRHSACYVLGKIGPAAKQAAPALEKNLNSDDKFLRLVSVWALLRILPGEARIAQLATPLLTQALQDEREMVRAEAASALGDIGEIAKPTIPALNKALDDPSPAVRAAAAEALKKLAP